jgi:hypothetical protein
VVFVLVEAELLQNSTPELVLMASMRAVLSEAMRSLTDVFSRLDTIIDLKLGTAMASNTAATITATISSIRVNPRSPSFRRAS